MNVRLPSVRFVGHFQEITRAQESQGSSSRLVQLVEGKCENKLARITCFGFFVFFKCIIKSIINYVERFKLDCSFSQNVDIACSLVTWRKQI